MNDSNDLPDGNEKGFGPKLPPIENGKKVIENVINHLSQLLNKGGIDFNGYARLAGQKDLNFKLKIEEESQDLILEILEPQPRLEILSLLKSNITDITVNTEKIAISISKFPDLEIEVKS
jgi:hypothetical protein